MVITIPLMDDNNNNNNDAKSDKKKSKDSDTDSDISDSKSVLSFKTLKEKFLNVASIRRTSQTIMLIVILITIYEYKPIMEKIINHVINEEAAAAAAERYIDIDHSDSHDRNSSNGLGL